MIPGGSGWKQRHRAIDDAVRGGVDTEGAGKIKGNGPKGPVSHLLLMRRTAMAITATPSAPARA